MWIIRTVDRGQLWPEALYWFKVGATVFFCFYHVCVLQQRTRANISILTRRGSGYNTTILQTFSNCLHKHTGFCRLVAVCWSFHVSVWCVCVEMFSSSCPWRCPAETTQSQRTVKSSDLCSSFKNLPLISCQNRRHGTEVSVMCWLWLWWISWELYCVIQYLMADMTD